MHNVERLARVIPSPHLHRVLRTADGNFYNKREPQHDKYHSSWQKLEHIFSLAAFNELWVKADPRKDRMVGVTTVTCSVTGCDRVSLHCYVL